MAEALADPAGIFVIDDTTFPKQGKHSAGVQRQYCGALGKKANCQCGVSVHYVAPAGHYPLNMRLFLPDSWLAETDPGDPPAFEAAGLAQLDRYLARAWHRAGIAPDRRDDCTQGVYLALIEGWRPDRFRSAVGEVSRRGVPAVFGRETPEGPGFFRAVDRIKKQAQRARSHVSLDAVGAPAARPEDRDRVALREAIAAGLSRREAALIDATLAGESAAEIAAGWEVAAKTISNEKSRIVSKLRGLLGPCD